MPTEIQIVPMTEDYAEGYRDCLGAVARERKWIGMVEAIPLERAQEFIRKIQERGDIGFVALDGEQVIGWIDVTTPTTEGFTHQGHLGMGLLNGYRGQGLGTRLMQVAIDAARAKGLERVELGVYVSNHRAQRLYKRFGFVVEGVKRHARKLDGVYDDIMLMAVVWSDK